MPRDYSVRLAEVEDLGRVLEVQHRAFGRVARDLDIAPDRLPPLVETLDDLWRLEATGVVFFVAQSAAGDVVGAVRGSCADGVAEVGRLVVDDGWERRGVGTALMDALEGHFAGARSYVLFTGADARAALAFYHGRGYLTSHHDVVGGVALVWLHKQGPAAI